MAGRRTTPTISPDAFETGKLVVELLSIARVRRGSPRATPALTPHGIRAAIHLAQHGVCSVGDLAAGLGISRGWASRVVEELEAAGYVERQRSRHDRRIVLVRLAPSAVPHVEDAFRWRAETIELALQPYGPRERRAIRGFLRAVIDRLATPPAAGPDGAD